MDDWNAWEDSLLDDNQISDEEQYVEPVDEQQEETYENSYEEQEDGDILDEYLKSKGINPEGIRFETEDGYQEIPFNELSREEQLQILGDNDPSYDLTDDEINLLNQMRSQNWSSEDYNNYIAKQAIENYTQNQQSQEPVYNIDDYSDEELFVMDLQAKIPDITEDEAVEELQNAKNNETLFQKRMESLRSEYKAKEDEEREYQDKQAQQAQEQQFNEFRDTILNTIEQNRDIDLGGLPMEMSDEDMNTVASFILDSDAAGVRHIAKALNDPNAIFQMAWWLTRGQDAFREINNYYKQQITEVAKRNYNKGLEDGQSGNVNSAKAVVRKPRKSSKSPKTDGDLYDGLI